jgi:hypothetical protein
MLIEMNRESNNKPVRGKTIDMGSIQVIADIPKIISLGPLFGGLTLMWGILWLVIGATRS